MKDIVLTGVPRGGTTLACRLLGDCHDTVALFEPMDVQALPAGDADAAVRQVERYFATTRRQLREQGWARSKLLDGRLPDNPFGAPEPGSGIRRLQVSEGALHAPVAPGTGFTLVIKHNAAFTALLPRLQQRFATIAIIRNPLAVLASWHSLALPVSDGRLPAGERLDHTLAGRLDAESDLIARQLAILDWFFARYARLPPQQVLAYEDMVASQADALFRLAGLVPRAPVQTLHDRNLAPACAPGKLPELAHRLLEHGGAWEPWYPAAAIAGLLQQMRAMP